MLIGDCTKKTRDASRRPALRLRYKASIRQLDTPAAVQAPGLAVRDTDPMYIHLSQPLDTPVPVHSLTVRYTAVLHYVTKWTTRHTSSCTKEEMDNIPPQGPQGPQTIKEVMTFLQDAFNSLATQQANTMAMFADKLASVEESCTKHTENLQIPAFTPTST